MLVLKKNNYMKYIVEWSNWNPVINKEVVDYIETNKTNLGHLWDNEKTEEENIQFLTDYFTKYPELMRFDIDIKNISSINSKPTIKNSSPIVQNIGGVKDFRSF
jgi:hypothetical protein